jgi:hypothetical protein
MKKIISTFLALVMTLSTFSYVCAEEEDDYFIVDPTTVTFDLYYFVETDGSVELTKDDFPTVENIDVSQYYPNAVSAKAYNNFIGKLEKSVPEIGDNFYYIPYSFEIDFGTDIELINFDTPYPVKCFTAISDNLSEIPSVTGISLFAKGYTTSEFGGVSAGYYDYYGDDGTGVAIDTRYPIRYAFGNSYTVFGSLLDNGYSEYIIRANLKWIYFVKTTDNTEPDGIVINGTYGDYYYGTKGLRVSGNEPDVYPDLSPELYIDDINNFARSLYYSVDNVEEVRVWYGYWECSSWAIAYAQFFDGTELGDNVWEDDPTPTLFDIREYPEGLPFEDTVLIKDFPDKEEQNNFIIRDVLKANGINSFNEYYDYCISSYPDYFATLKYTDKRNFIEKLYKICGETILMNYSSYYSWSLSDDGKSIWVGVDAIVMYLEEDELIDPSILRGHLLTPEQQDMVVYHVLKMSGIKNYEDYSAYCKNIEPRLTDEDVKTLFDVCYPILLREYNYLLSFYTDENGEQIIAALGLYISLNQDAIIDPVTLQEILGEELPRYGYVCDGETIGIGDVILLSKHVSKKLTLPADSQNYKNANCDLRDNAVNADDLKAMIDYLLGTIDSLPVRG